MFENGVGLRLLEPGDIEMIRTWRNRDDVRMYFDDPSMISVERQKEWFSRYRQRPDDYYFVIHWNDGEEFIPVGGVSLYDVSNGSAEYGRCMIGEERARRRGIMTRASRILFDIAKTQLSVSGLYLRVFRTNVRAVRLYERMGYESAGRTETHLFMNIRL